jgi:hypothetical protein
MVKLVIKLAIFGLLANAAYQVVPPFYNHWKFQDALKELASYPPRRTTVEQMKARCEKIAQAHDLELRANDFQVTLAGPGQATASIDTAYEVELRYFPGQMRPHVFAVHVVGDPPRLGSLSP